MTTSAYMSRLESLAKKVESVVQSFQYASIQPSKDQYQILEALGVRLAAAAANVPVEIKALKKRHTEPSFEEGRQLISQAQSDRRDIINTARLKSRSVFGRNISLFFTGPKDSVVDSSVTKARKQLTRERCQSICGLSPDGLISWAIAYTPTTWTANLMSNDTFDYVVKHIEPEDALVWPSEIYDILSSLGAEEPLRGSDEYHEFLEAVEESATKARSSIQLRKQRHIEDGQAPESEQFPAVPMEGLATGETWCYGASQSPPPPILHNSQTLALPAASAPSPPYQTAPHFSQTVDIPIPGRYDARDGSGSQQMNFNMSQEPASISNATHSHDIQNRPDDPETEHQHGRVLISNMMNPAPRKQPMTHYQVTDERASKRPRLGPQQISGNLVLPGGCQYWSFSFTSRHMVENLPEPFRTGMKMSNLWRKENESGGLAVTNCLSLYLPETFSEDALFVVRVGCLDGFNICNFFGFGDPDTPGFEEGTAKEARD